MSEEGSVLATGNPVETQGQEEAAAVAATSELTSPEWVSDEYRSFVDNKGW